MRSDEHPDDVKNLRRLADEILSISEKVDSEEPLSTEEIGALRSVKKVFRQAEERPAVPRWRWAVVAAAAAVLITALGFFASGYFSPSRKGVDSTLTLAMRPADGTRSPASWTTGDAFVIDVSLAADLFLHIVHLDAKAELEFVFPLHDPGAQRWSFLGHRDNRIQRNTAVSIPAQDFPMTFTIETAAAGEEYLIAFATPQAIAEDELAKLRAELREEVERAKEAEADAEAMARRIGELVAQRFPGPQAVRRYTVK